MIGKFGAVFHIFKNTVGYVSCFSAFVICCEYAYFFACAVICPKGLALSAAVIFYNRVCGVKNI